MSDGLHHRVTVTLRTLTIVSAIASGIALGFTLNGQPRFALVAVILILFANIVSIETLRAFAALQSREPRR